jgi:hypothetical protein
MTKRQDDGGVLTFQIPDEVASIAKILEKNQFEAYLVGGCVRDLLLGRKPKDWDITTNAKPEEIKENNNTIWTAIPIGIAVLILFFLLQKSGILNIGLGKVTPTTSFIIGLIASLSSCLAIVGGLVLSLD